MMENPLLDLTGLPRFSEIKPDHVESALDALLAENRAQIKALESVSNQANWNNFVAPLDHIEERLDRLWATVSHLNAVCDSEELRRAYEASLEKWTTYQTEVSQNRELFAGFKRIEESGELDRLDLAKQKTVGNAIRDFRLGGVELEGPFQLDSTQSKITNRITYGFLFSEIEPVQFSAFLYPLKSGKQLAILTHFRLIRGPFFKTGLVRPTQLLGVTNCV